MNEVSPFNKGLQEEVKPLPSAFHPSSRDAATRCHLGSRRQPSPDTEPAKILILDFPISRTMRRKSVMVRHYPVSDVL
jgi:hypothetical protein